MVELFFVIAFPIPALLSLFLFYIYRNTKDKLSERESELNRKIFELQILSEVSQKTGTSLSSKDVAASIAVTAEKVLPLSSISYAIIESDHIDLNTIIRERVGENYLTGVKNFILQGLYEVDSNVKGLPVYEKLTEDFQKKKNVLVDLGPDNDDRPNSYFNIPLVLNGKFTGVINISSIKSQAYQEADMSMIYKIVNQAHETIDRLESVISTEKGKVDALVRSLSSGAIFFSLENNKLNLYTANNAARRFLNIPANETDVLNFLSNLPLNPNIVAEMQNVILQKKSTVYRKITIGNMHFNIYISPVFKSKTDELIGVAITLQDITAEIELEKLRADFTNVIVHELRAPLTSIKGAATLLQETNLSAEESAKMREVIRTSSERLLEDITEILDSAKIDSGKMNIVKAKANINEAIKTSSQQLSYMAQSRGIMIENKLDSNIPDFSFDAQRIGQVINNLLSNAIKFSKDNSKIMVYSIFESGIVKVTVQDSGVGIPPDKIPTLFKPFSQLNSDKRSKGTGLGLYITKAIVEGHGGNVSIDSKPGVGTAMSFTIPVVMMEEAVKPTRPIVAN